MKALTRLALAVSVAGLSLGIAACGGGGGGPGAKTLDLTIGDIVPLTGDLAPFGPPGQKAAELAVSQLNAAISKAGASGTVKIENQDEETKPGPSVDAARKLEGDGASCIVGAWASSDTIPTARSVSIRDGILEISPSSTSDEITGLSDSGLLNRTAPPDAFQGPTLADAIDKDLGGAQGKTVNVGARNDAYGTGLAGTFSAAWEAKGGTIGQKVIYDPNATSYDAEAAKITSGSPDATVIIDFPETFVKVGPALARTGNWDPTTAWATDGLDSSDVGKQGATVEGMRGTVPGEPNVALSKDFDKLYAQSSPSNVKESAFDAQTFDATVLCYLSAVAAGSTDGTAMAAKVREVSAPPGTQYTWQQLPDAIKALQDGKDIDYQGASGPIDMNDAGDATAGVYDLYQFKNGTPVTIGQQPVATPSGSSSGG